MPHAVPRVRRPESGRAAGGKSFASSDSSVMTVTLDLARSAPFRQSVAPSSPTAAALPGLIGLSREVLGRALADIGVPERQLRMRVGQLWHWLYVRGVSDFEAMTNVSKDLRRQLAEKFAIARPEIVSEQISVDGTRKWLFRCPDRKSVG